VQQKPLCRLGNRHGLRTKAWHARANDHPTTAAPTSAPRQLLLAVKTTQCSRQTLDERDPDDQSRADCEIKISHQAAKIKDLRADNA
jgi:hypothetical protein